MARRRKSDMTLAQKTAADNDKFRGSLRAEHLDEVAAAPSNDDLAAFRNTSYKQALRDAKANR